MALDVTIQPELKTPRSSDACEPICYLQDDGYYWFLHPLFEALYKETGEYIDLYGGAIFFGETLEALKRTLGVARRLVDEQSDRWEVVTGVWMGPEPKEIRATVNKREMVELLDTLEAAVNRARDLGYCVTFWGD